MAVGAPENEVFAAADAALARGERGERPKVEHVRLEFERGSPARVGELLDQWWARLAERLSGEIYLPALPAEVSQAFVAICTILCSNSAHIEFVPLLLYLPRGFAGSG